MGEVRHRRREASSDAIRVRGYGLTIDRNPSPQPSKSELRSSRPNVSELARLPQRSRCSLQIRTVSVMRLRIAHSTSYRYEPPATGVIQILRMTPGSHDGQYVA